MQRYSQFVFQLVFPAYTLQLPSICVLPNAFTTFCSNNLGILTGTSWHFSDISSDISARWAHESTSLDVNTANGMLTGNAKRIFCDNVTCFGTSKSCSNQSHLQECFNCSSLLACKAATVQLSICFPSLSRIHLTATLYLCPADCFRAILFLRILTGSSWHFSDISSDIPASWAHGSTSLDVDKANGMLTSNAKSIFSDNVTCFARSKHVSQIRDICKSASIAPHFLLARLQRYSFQFVFQVFSTYTLQLPSIRVLPTAFKNLSSEAHEYRASCSAC